MYQRDPPLCRVGATRAAKAVMVAATAMTPAAMATAMRRSRLVASVVPPCMAPSVPRGRGLVAVPGNSSRRCRDGCLVRPGALGGECRGRPAAGVGASGGGGHVDQVRTVPADRGDPGGVALRGVCGAGWVTPRARQGRGGTGQLVQRAPGPRADL